ncbi:uncharacterized protein LOC122645783 [Telopea speciosissima]|uniref:uncharacterized protein LOC122645783 n=1 Tax=Telopea speciosissima TaxID=54955 RepID=UPI001CC75978|nr:uncharacterized protein LOC122645783 [Telopea speciosissima]
MMASRFIAKGPGFVDLGSHKLTSRTQRSIAAGFAGSNTLQFVSGRIWGRRNWCSIAALTHIKCAASSGRNQQELRFNEDENRSEPFWSSLIKEAIWALRSLLVFLLEQPGQLKYIEWPSFQSTLKTATLTLVLVAFLIVAIASVDSALCYLLTLMLRKSA